MAKPRKKMGATVRKIGGRNCGGRRRETKHSLGLRRRGEKKCPEKGETDIDRGKGKKTYR